MRTRSRHSNVTLISFGVDSTEYELALLDGVANGSYADLLPDIASMYANDLKGKESGIPVTKPLGPFMRRKRFDWEGVWKDGGSRLVFPRRFKCEEAR